MSETPTTAGTWAPDWRTLKRARDKAIRKIPYANDDQFNEAAYGAIVDEYQRQSAAAGWVLVRRKTLERMLMDYEVNLPDDPYNRQSGDDILEMAEALTAATPAASPGGDAG